MVFDSHNAANDVLLNSTLQSSFGAVSSFDQNDFHRFHVGSGSGGPAYISLNGLKADADMVLRNADGNVISVSRKTGNSPEAIKASLATGTYYVQVLQRSGNTAYTLNISSNPLFEGISDNVKFVTGDFNGDGWDDLIRQEQGSLINGVSDTQVYTGRFDNRYNAGVDITNMGAVAGNVANLIAGDFNGDGRDDLLRQEIGAYVNGVNDVQILDFKNGNFQVAANMASMAVFNGNYTNLIAGDFNQDGRADLIRQEKGVWVNNQNDDVQIHLSTGGWNFSPVQIGSNVSIMTGNDTQLVARGSDIMRLEFGKNVNDVNDVNFTSFVNGSLTAFQLAPTKNFSSAVVPKPWAAPITSLYQLNATSLGKLISNQATIISPFGTNGRYSVYEKGTIQWSAKTGAVVISQAMDNVYSAQGRSGSWLGLPVGKEFSWNGGMRQEFEGGYLFRDANNAGAFRFNQLPRLAPANLQFSGLQASYEPNGTLQLSNGFVSDNNGWVDVAKVDFWLMNSQNQRIELPDAISFSIHNASLAKFTYQTTLPTLATGSYKLFAVAYDKTGLSSAQTIQSFEVKAPNIAPSGLIIDGLKSSYTIGSSLQLATSYAGDRNGWNDVAKVDFWLENASKQRIELADATSFSQTDNFWANFQYGTSLAGIASGDYTFRAIAYDKAGLAGSTFDKAISVVNPNVAPTSLKIQGLKPSYDANSNLQIGDGFVWDQNGWADINRVDFWLMNEQNQRIELDDVTSFTSYDANYARFSYAASLSKLSAGTYKLSALAYDKSGAASTNSLSESFSIKDWFDINLKDINVINLARNAAADLDLSRNEMLNIFRNIKDEDVIDSIELGDISTLVKNAKSSLFSMKENVFYLANKVVAETVANMQASIFESGVMGKWFLGTVLPGSRFTYTPDNTGLNDKTFNFTYQISNASLFNGANQARISGIDQRRFGDCVLLASLGATFSSQRNEWGAASKQINDMLIDNGDQTYSVSFFEKDTLQKQWVTVNRQLAFFEGQLFGASDVDGLWMPIIEKAYAQWREWNEGNGQKTGWDIIGNGDNLADGLRRITGRTATNYWVGSSQDYTFDLIQGALASGKAITAGGALGSSFLVGSHAYSVTNAYMSDKGERRVVVRNPWGLDAGSGYTPIGDPNDGFLDLSFEQFRAFKRIAIA